MQIEAKKYFVKMNDKLGNPNTAIKAYWTISNRLLYNKKMLAMLLLFMRKQTFLIASLHHVPQKTIILPSFSYRKST